MLVKKGEIYENWVILDDTVIKRSNRVYVFCKCTMCNITIKYVQLLSLTNKKELRTKLCSNCNYKLLKKRNLNKDIIGDYNNAERVYYSKIKSRAKIKNKEFTVTIDHVFDLLKKQKFKCALSKLDLNFYNKNATITASLDRIDSNKGYIKGNIQWVLKDINRMKSDFNQEYFISLIQKILDNKHNGRISS